jgi:hypothetical protein
MATAELADHLGIDLWAVVGGQMVVLHASERGVALPSDRQTTDGDVVVDVRSSPTSSRSLGDVQPVTRARPGANGVPSLSHRSGPNPAESDP